MRKILSLNLQLLQVNAIEKIIGKKPFETLLERAFILDAKAFTNRKNDRKIQIKKAYKTNEPH